MAKITLEIIPRDQFRGYIERVQRWACLVVHRRGGKTFGCIQDLLRHALTHKRPGPPLRYAYVAPTRDQAKDIAWGYLKQFCGKIPGVKINEADLMITLPNAATIRLYSGESYERMRGVYLDGVVLDEFADIDPNAWYSVIRPCLSDYQGWATFIGTSKGRNEFWRIHRRAQKDSEWFSLLLKASDSGILPDEELSDIRKGTPEHLYRQEYECDFTIGMPGAIYAREVSLATEENRVTMDVAYREGFPVYTSWDIGAPINTRVWIFQLIADRIVYLECLSGGHDCRTAADWTEILQSKKYRYGAHFLPHDAEVNWLDLFKQAGLANCVIVPKRDPDIWGPINDVLEAFSRCWFHEEDCKIGLQGLEAYHSKEARDGVTIQDVPVHDWSSHTAEALSLGHQAIRAGLVIDRTAIPKKPRNSIGGSRVVAGIRDDRSSSRARVVHGV